MLVFAVGALTDKFIDGQVGGLRRILIRKAHRIVVFSSVQVESTSRLLGVPSVRVVFTPFGVDLEFLAYHARPKRWDVVAAGTNEGKDYPTLLRALQPGETCLIVTDARNAAEIASTLTKGRVQVAQDVPITDLVDRYAEARRVVIPLHDVLYSTGQTVLLENLAMGRPVIVSDVSVVRDYISPAVATAVPPEDVDALRGALDEEWERVRRRLC